MQLKCSAPTGEPNRPPEGAAGAEIPLQIPVCPDGKDFHGAEGIHGEHPCCPGENNEHRKGTAAAKRAGGGIFILIALFSLLAMNAEFETFVYRAWLAGHCCLCKLSEDKEIFAQVECCQDFVKVNPQQFKLVLFRFSVNRVPQFG